MTDIIVRPAREFGLSLGDRGRPGGPWFHSFIGTVRFVGENEVEESNVPVAFILTALIETSFLIRSFGLVGRIIPIPSTDRELEISSDNGIQISCIRSGNDKTTLNISLGDSDINRLFDNLVQLMMVWQPDRTDDEYFLRSHWLLDAALDAALRQTG